MVMPPTIMAVATSRKASIPLPGCHSRNIGETRLRIRANITTKIGRLPIMVETRDTVPLSIDHNNSNIPPIAKVSLKASRPIAEFLRFILPHCLRIWGRIETSKKIPDRQNPPSQDIFQNEM